MKRIAVLTLALSILAPAAHARFRGGVDQTFAKNDYDQTTVFAALGGGGGWSIAPEWSRYKSNAFAGSFNRFSARVGFDRRLFGFGFAAAVVPEHLLYKSVHFAGDVAITLAPTGEGGIRRIGGAGGVGAPTGKGVARIDLGGGVAYTKHERSASAPAAAAELQQTEVHAFAGASIAGFLASARVAKSVYDQDPASMTLLPSPRWIPLAGQAIVGRSYPDASISLRGEFSTLPMVRPFVKFVTTTYEPLPGGVKPQRTNAAGFGAAVGLQMLRLDIEYQRITASDLPDDNALRVGASIRL